jgi:hypothetical protein
LATTPRAELKKHSGAPKIELKLVRTNYVTRWPCTICGGHTEKVLVLTEYSDPSGEVLVRVCEHCLESGDIDGRLKKHADIFEGLAQHTRALVGLLKVPTYEEWEAEEQRAIDELTADCAD